MFKVYNDDFVEMNIFSYELLKNVLSRYFTQIYFSKNYYSIIKDANIENEIKNVYANCIVLSYDDIKLKLPFIPIDVIKIVCSRNPNFVRCSEAKYALVSKIIISEEDIKNSEIILSNDIEQLGFSILSHIDTTYSEAQNPEISSNALKETLFSRYYSDKYDRKRTIIYEYGKELRMYDVISKYCEDFDTLKLQEVEEYEKSLTGRCIYTISAICNSMIRIDKENFVRKDTINFDITAVDNIIEKYSNGRIISFNDFDSFITFPYIEGYSWNIYLLESFCRMYSQRFKTMESIAKKRPTGAIIPSYMNFETYNDLLAKVIVDNNIELDCTSINKYLLDKTYILRKMDTEVIISKAHNIRLQEE